jgi:hypothetical protein
MHNEINEGIKTMSEEAQDKNTVYLYVGKITRDVIRDHVANLIAKVSLDLEVAVTDFVVNMPVNSSGVKQQYCYIWFDSSVVLDHILKAGDQELCEFEGARYSLLLTRCSARISNNERLLLSSLMSVKPLPEWVTQDDIRGVFARYNVSGYFAVRFAKKNDGRHVFINYDRGSNDAMFALLMCKVVTLEHDGETELLFFNYAQKQQTRK